MSQWNPRTYSHRLLWALLAGNLAYFVSIFIHDSFDFFEQNYHLPDHLYALFMMAICVELMWQLTIWLDGWLEVPQRFKQRAALQGLISMGVMAGLIALADATLPEFTLTTLRHYQELDDIAHAMVIKKVRVYSTFGLTIVLLNIAYFSWRFLSDWHKVQLEAEQLHKETVVNQLQTLKNQIHPRFWFASLETLIRLVHQDSDLSEKFIKKLALFYRYNLANNEKELITLDEELEFVQVYIDLMNIQYPNRVNLQVQLAPCVYQYLLPSKALQKVFEQILQTNLYNISKPLTIRLQVSKNRHLVVGYSGLKKLRVYESVSCSWLAELNQIYQFYTSQQVVEQRLETHSEIVLPLLQLDE